MTGCLRNALNNCSTGHRPDGHKAIRVRLYRLPIGGTGSAEGGPELSNWFERGMWTSPKADCDSEVAVYWTQDTGHVVDRVYQSAS